MDGRETVRITGTGSELQGVGRLANGMAVFVPGALPGELVEIIPEKTSKRFMEARLARVLEPSAGRAASACPLYGRCGGCAARHMSYEETLRLKRQRVEDALRRLAGLEDVPVYPTIGAEAREHGRNKAEFAIGRDETGRLVAGPTARRSHQVLRAQACLLQHESVNRALMAFNELLQEGAPWSDLVCRVNGAGELMLILCGKTPADDAVRSMAAALRERLPELASFWYLRQKPRPVQALDGRAFHIWGKPALEETLLGLDFTVSPRSFFQVNTPQAERLYTIALDAALESGGGRLLDAYCGTGTMALCAAARGAEVMGVEIVPEAIEDARANAARNGLADRSAFACGDAARLLPDLMSRSPSFDQVLLDPPRKGVDKPLLETLCASGIPRIVYVSCDPGSLARDLNVLKQAYKIHWAQPVDMFTWSHHVETVVLMSRVKD